MTRYKDEEATMRGEEISYDLSGLIHNRTKFSYGLSGSSSPANGSDLTEEQARMLKNTALIIGGVLTVVATAGTAPALTAVAATLQGFQVVSGTMAVAAGIGKSVLDLKGDIKNSDKIPTGYLGATIGATLTITMEEGKKQQIIKGTLTLVEGGFTFTYPTGSLSTLGGNSLTVTNVVLDGDVQKAPGHVTNP